MKPNKALIERDRLRIDLRGPAMQDFFILYQLWKEFI
jgi:hypothetical protein